MGQQHLTLKGKLRTTMKGMTMMKMQPIRKTEKSESEEGSDDDAEFPVVEEDNRSEKNPKRKKPTDPRVDGVVTVTKGVTEVAAQSCLMMGPSPSLRVWRLIRS